MKRTLVGAFTGSAFWIAIAGGCSLTTVAPILDGPDDGSTRDGPLDSPSDDTSPDAMKGDAEAGACPPPLVLRYESAGCASSAHPVCGRVDQDACAIPVCGCDGKTIVKCDYADRPWERVGACEDAADALADQATSDANSCAPPLVLRFESPGCGAAAHPVCGTVDQDACAISVCGCNGVTIIKCDYASEAWDHEGTCAPDASSDAKSE